MTAYQVLCVSDPQAGDETMCDQCAFKDTLYAGRLPVQQLSVYVVLKRCQVICRRL